MLDEGDPAPLSVTRFHSRPQGRGSSGTRVYSSSTCVEANPSAMGNRYTTARCADEGSQQLPPLPPLTAGEGRSCSKGGGEVVEDCIPCHSLAWNRIRWSRDPYNVTI